MIWITPIRAIFATILGFVMYIHTPLSNEREDEASLTLVQQLLKNIKNDKSNESFRKMINDKVMQEHTLSNHAENQPYFYSNDSYVITDMINLVLDDPDGIIDETAESGILKIYREFNYPEEIEELFDREQRPPGKFQNAYLGQTITGPTNRVAVVLKIKGDEQSEDALAQRLVYTGNNIQYFDAYPIEGSPTDHEPVEVETGTEAVSG